MRSLDHHVRTRARQHCQVSEAQVLQAKGVSSCRDVTWHGRTTYFQHLNESCPGSNRLCAKLLHTSVKSSILLVCFFISSQTEDSARVTRMLQKKALAQARVVLQLQRGVTSARQKQSVVAEKKASQRSKNGEPHTARAIQKTFVSEITGRHCH